MRDGRRRQEERQRRPPGRDLERERRADEQQPDQDQDVVAVPERRPEPPDPGEQHHDDQDRAAAASRRSSRRRATVSRRPSASIFSMSVGVERSPLRTMTSPWTDRHEDRGDRLRRPSRGPARSASALNDELGTTSGRSARRRASAPPRRGRRPSGPTAGLRVSATSVSRSSVRWVASRTRAASVRTAAQRAASSADQRRAARCRSGPAAPVAGATCRPSGGQLGREGRVDRARPARSKASCWAAAIAIAFSVVKSYCGGDRGAGRVARGRRSGRRSRSRGRAGATMSRGASSPARDVERRLGQDVGAEDRRQRQDQDAGRDQRAAGRRGG